MALLQAEFQSKTLKRKVPFNVVLPIEKFLGPYPTLYLLHGLTDNCNGWLSNTRIRMWAEDTGLAVVMPSGENSFYMDILVKDGCLGDFGEYIGRELVEVTREMFPLSDKREDTFIAGLSMGGFGACRNGLKYSDVFSKAAVLSGALHFYEYPAEWVETNGNTIGEVRNFGNLEETRNTDRNPRFLMEQIKNDPDREFPEFYVACGLQDVLLEANRSIAKALKEAGAKVPYVDREKIGVIGICGSGGFALSAAQVDTRIKAVATTSMYDISDVRGMFGSNMEALEAEKKRLSAQRWTDFENGRPEYIPSFPEEPYADGEMPVTGTVADEWNTFYATKRGFHPNARGGFTTTSNMAFTNFRLLDFIAEISPRPILFVMGDRAHSKFFSENAYAAAAEPKELYVVDDAEHIDLYDRVDRIPFDKLESFFKENLK